MPARKPRSALTLREEVALRFATAIVGSPLAENILEGEQGVSAHTTYTRVAEAGFGMADAFLAVAGELSSEHPV